MKKLIVVLAVVLAVFAAASLTWHHSIPDGVAPKETVMHSLGTQPAEAAITSAISNQWKNDTLSTMATHTLKIALYNGATMDASTTAYTATNEVSNSGTGYTTGGSVLSGVTVTSFSNTYCIDANDLSWASSTFTADGAMLYDASNSNHAIRVFSFTSTSSNNSTFTLTMPGPDSTHCLFRLP